MKEDDLPRMVFVCGAPRSGTDLLVDFLTVSRRAGWIPQSLADHPDRLSLAGRVNRQSWPLLGEFFLERRAAWKSVPAPATDARFLEHHCPEFTPPIDAPVMPGPGRVSEASRDRLRGVVTDLAHRQRRSALVLTYTGFPRIRMLREVFPDARFIQSIRDPRSVAYQMVRKVEKMDRSFLEFHEAYAALMPEVLQDRLKELPDSPLVFCGVYARWLHELYKQELAELPEGRGMEVAYSDLLSRPRPTLKKVLEFADFPFNKRFEYYLKFHDIQVSNLRSNRNLNDEESDQLARAVAPV